MNPHPIDMRAAPRTARTIEDIDIIGRRIARVMADMSAAGITGERRMEILKTLSRDYSHV